MIGAEVFAKLIAAKVPVRSFGCAGNIVRDSLLNGWITVNAWIQNGGVTVDRIADSRADRIESVGQVRGSLCTYIGERRRHERKLNSAFTWHTKGCKTGAVIAYKLTIWLKGQSCRAKWQEMRVISHLYRFETAHCPVNMPMQRDWSRSP